MRPQQQQQQQQQQKNQQPELQQRQQVSPASNQLPAADDAEDGSSRSSRGSGSSQQQLTPQQLRSLRIQQQLANYRPKQLRGKREPPMVPSLSFAAAVALACLGCLLVMGGGVCLVKQCNASSEIGIALLVTSGLLVAISVALFASLPCCYCDKARNCQVRAACSERWQQLRSSGKRRQARVGSIGSSGISGAPAITIKDYSSSSASGRAPRVTLPQSPTSSSDDGDVGGGDGQQMWMPVELAWCYEGAPADPGMLHPMYGRRGSWNGISPPDYESPPPTSMRRV